MVTGWLAGWPSVRHMQMCKQCGPSIIRCACSFPPSKLDDAVSPWELLHAKVGGTDCTTHTHTHTHLCIRNSGDRCWLVFDHRCAMERNEYHLY